MSDEEIQKLCQLSNKSRFEENLISLIKASILINVQNG